MLYAGRWFQMTYLKVEKYQKTIWKVPNSKVSCLPYKRRFQDDHKARRL